MTTICIGPFCEHCKNPICEQNMAVNGDDHYGDMVQAEETHRPVLVYAEEHNADEQCLIEGRIMDALDNVPELQVVPEQRMQEVAGDILMLVLAHYRPDLVEEVPAN